jgi:hypothetical protein
MREMASMVLDWYLEIERDEERIRERKMPSL